MLHGYMAYCVDSTEQKSQLNILMYKPDQTVAFYKQRCACVGGGRSEHHGRIVGILPRPNGNWYQIDQPSGIVTVKEADIIRII